MEIALCQPVNLQWQVLRPPWPDTHSGRRDENGHENVKQSATPLQKRTPESKINRTRIDWLSGDGIRMGKCIHFWKQVVAIS